MERLQQLLGRDMESNSLTAFGLDWKTFDANMPAWLLDICFDVLEKMIDFSTMTVRDERINFTDDKASEYKRAFNFVRQNFIHTKIMLPDGTVLRKDQGVPSGSYFTQIVGSLANLILIRTLFKFCN